MIALALLLLAIAVALMVMAVVEGSGSVTVEVADVQVDSPVWGVFLAGSGAGLIALGGIITLVVGIRRARERREEIEYLREKVAQQERAAGRSGLDDPTNVAAVGEWLEGQGRSRHAADPATATESPGGAYRART